MSTSALRDKIIERFNDIIEDPSKLDILEGIFDSITTNSDTSHVPEEHYRTVQERREKYHAETTTGASWKEVKQYLLKKHGL